MEQDAARISTFGYGPAEQASIWGDFIANNTDIGVVHGADLSDQPPRPQHEVEIDDAIARLRGQGMSYKLIGRKLSRHYHPDTSGFDSPAAFRYLSNQLNTRR